MYKYIEHIFAAVSLVVFPLCCAAQAFTPVVGVMYFGNGGGMLSFDGMSWSLHKLPQDKTVRSVFTDEGLIYVGSYEEFGFFEKAADGSFIGNVRREPAVNGNVWDISTFDVLWDCFMQNEDVKSGLTKLGFSYTE